MSNFTPFLIMNKVIIGTLGGLVVGVASGFFAADSAKPEAPQSLSDSITSQQRAPRFGQTKVSTASSVEQKSVAKKKAQDLPAILKEGDQMKRISGLLDYYNALTPEQMKDEAKQLSLLSWEDRMLASKMLFTKWAELAPKQAMEYANGRGNRGGFDRMMIMDAWSSKNPEMAAAYYMENKEELDGGRSRTAGSIAKGWARLNPEAALGWAQGLEGRGRGEAISSVFDALLEKDPALAVQKMGTLSAEDLKESRVVTNLADKWAKKDWAATEAWMNTLPVDQQDVARGQALRSLAEVDVAAAAQKVAQLPAGELKDGVVSSVARAMAVENPSGAADWVLKNASESSLADSVNGIMSNWVRRDTEGAKGWVNALPDGKAKINAIMDYARMTPSKDYGETLSMVSGAKVDAESRDDRRQQYMAMSDTYRKWSNEDANAAKNWADNSGLSDRQKRFLTYSSQGGHSGGGAFGGGGRGARGGGRGGNH